MGFSLEKDVICLVTRVGQRKKLWIPMRNRTSDLRIPRPDALPLSHRDSTVSEVYYEVLRGFSLVCKIVRSRTIVNFHQFYTLQLVEPSNLAKSIQLVSLWNKCIPDLPKPLSLHCPSILHYPWWHNIFFFFICPFTLLRFGLMAILWTFSHFNAHSESQTEWNFDGNCERIPFFWSKRYLMREYFDQKSRIF